MLPVNVLRALTVVPELAVNPDVPVPVVAGWMTGVGAEVADQGDRAVGLDLDAQALACVRAGVSPAERSRLPVELESALSSTWRRRSAVAGGRGAGESLDGQEWCGRAGDAGDGERGAGGDH